MTPLQIFLTFVFVKNKQRNSYFQIILTLIKVLIILNEMLLLA